MTSSLATQLVSGASLNASLLVDRSRRKVTESYLFTGREADHHDFYSLHALGLNALLQLRSLNKAFHQFEESLFSDAARVTDRTLLQLDKVAELDENISKFTKLLGPYLMEAPAGKVLEWLVRRFRINEFNIDDSLALFLPYHESIHFAKMVTLLHIKPQSKWHFLLAHKSAAKQISRPALVTEMLRNVDLSRFIASLLPEAVKSGYPHRTLIAFHTSTLIDYISRSKSLDESTLALLLPALLQILQPSIPTSKVQVTKDAVLSSYVLLSALSQKVHFSGKALRTIIATVAKSSQEGLSTKHMINTILSICAPQSQLEKVPSSVIKVVLASPNVLVESLTLAGSEKFVSPLLAGLIGHLSDPSTTAIVHSILASQNALSVTVCVAIRALLQILVSEDMSSWDQSRKLLSEVRLRHPDLLQTVAQEIMAEGDSKEKIEQIILSLSLTTLGEPAVTRASSEMIIATTDSDPIVRSGAVRKIFERLSSADFSLAEREECRVALLARVSDTDVSVITTLYSRPSDMLSFLDESFVGLVVNAVHSSSRQIARLHLEFLTHHFVSKYSFSAMKVVDECLWPFLMFSKARHKTTAAIWGILESEKCSEEIAKFELLGGCLDAIRWEEEKPNPPDRRDEANDGQWSVDKMARVDLALSNKIAENILSSNSYAIFLDLLLRKLQDRNGFSRSLGYLVSRSLLSRLSGKHRVDAAHRVLEAMCIDTLEGIDNFMLDSGDLQLFLHDSHLSTCVVLKPNSDTTTNRLKMSILAMIPSIPKPINVSLNWVGGKQATTDTRGVRYADLMCSIYRLANSTSSLPAISAYLIRAQFMSLKDDALVFLAGIWTSPVDFSATSQDNNEYRFHQVALHHAAAFLMAYRTTQNWVDFQVVLPLVLYALENPNQGVREAAVQFLLLMDKLCEAEKPVAIYGYDTVYGERTAELQYLEWADLRRYIRAVVEHQHHFVNDSGYIRVFQQQCLAKQKSDTKKDSAYKRRILCYLLSHVNACCRPVVKLGLLRSLREVSDRSKIQMLLSAITDAVMDPSSSALVSIFGPLSDEFVALLVASFDSSAAKALNDSEGMSWPVFLQSLTRSFSSSSISSYRDILIQNIEHGLFRRLMFDRQVELCRMLLELGSSNSQANSLCRSVLMNTLQDVPLVLHLVNQLQPITNVSAPPANKRARLDISQMEAPRTDLLGQLTLLCEVLSSTATLENSIDIISALLDTLNKVFHCEESDVAYLEQLLMSTLENMTTRVRIVENAPTPFTLDVLVEIIRVSDNPQTFHQALLLISNFARLAPEAVLRNVMPIFTFMGSNVFHRDDDYSFKVVQKTIDSIVPVMASSLQSAHSIPLELYIAAKEFLIIFTDAATHIPRHRRTSFFSYLVDVLGPDQYLAPVCMLLVDKVANRVTRQNAVDAQSSLAIALSLIQHYPSSSQMDVLIQAAQESRRIAFNIRNPENLERTFLDSDQNEDDVASVTSKRRAQALIMFIDSTLKQTQPMTSSSGDFISDLVSLLLQLSGLDHDSHHGMEKLSTASRVCLTSLLHIVPAVNFVESVLALIESSDVKMQVGALNLFGEQLPKMTDKLRREVTPSINKVIKHIETVLSTNGEQSLNTSALKALMAMGDTICAGEENSLSDIIPLILAMIQGHKSTEFAVGALASISVKLGPRIIPHFRKIVQECVRLASEELTSAEKRSPSLLTDSVQVLQGLLSAIPSFWAGEEIILVVDLYLSYGMKEVMTLSSLSKNVAKRVPSSVLLPTLCELWKSSLMSGEKGTDRLTAFFTLLKKSLHAAPRSEVLQHVRRLYDVFLQAFTLHSISETSDNEPFRPTIAAFLELVVKLNDTTFRPLFRKLYDWAFANEPGPGKQVVFCHIYIALLDFFKGLMTPYMSYMTTSFIDLLKAFTTSTTLSTDLWVSLIETLAKTFQVDEGGFWRDEKLRSLAPPLIQQISTSAALTTDGQQEAIKSTLADCISGLATSITDDDDLLKTINLQVLMQSRSEDPKQRIFALGCATHLWHSVGEKLVGFVAETGTFIAELAEDDNDTVVRETRKFKSVVESVAGTIDGL